MYPVYKFSYSYLSNILIRIFLRIYNLKNPVWILRHTNRKNNIRVRKELREWSKLNHPVPLKEFSQINQLKRNKGQAFKHKRYIGNNKSTKTRGSELESETNFKDRCSDLEGYIFETPSPLTDPEMPTIIPDTIVNHPKTDAEMTYLKNNIIHEATYQKLRNKDMYETNMHNIYNLIVDHTNKQL